MCLDCGIPPDIRRRFHTDGLPGRFKRRPWHDINLTASAPGAASYRWLMNGESITGGDTGSLSASYLRTKTTDAYQAVAIYSVDALTAESAPSAAALVESKPSATVLVVR